MKLSFSATLTSSNGGTRRRAPLTTVPQRSLSTLHGLLQALVLNPTQLGTFHTQNHYTPLHVACEKGAEDVVNLLISLGADVNALASVRPEANTVTVPYPVDFLFLSQPYFPLLSLLKVNFPHCMPAGASGRTRLCISAAGGITPAPPSCSSPPVPPWTSRTRRETPRARPAHSPAFARAAFTTTNRLAHCFPLGHAGGPRAARGGRRVRRRRVRRGPRRRRPRPARRGAGALGACNSGLVCSLKRRGRSRRGASASLLCRRAAAASADSLTLFSARRRCSPRRRRPRGEAPSVPSVPSLPPAAPLTTSAPNPPSRKTHRRRRAQAAMQSPRAPRPPRENTAARSSPDGAAGTPAGAATFGSRPSTTRRTRGRPGRRACSWRWERRRTAGRGRPRPRSPTQAETARGCRCPPLHAGSAVPQPGHHHDDDASPRLLFAPPSAPQAT